MDQPDARDSFEARALEFIKPGDAKRASCVEQLRLRMGLLRLVRDDQDANPSRANSRDEMQAVANAARKLLIVLRRMHSKSRALLFRVYRSGEAPSPDERALVADLKYLATASDMLTRAIVVKSGAQPRDAVGQVAALFARDLLGDFSNVRFRGKRPPLTDSGPYLQLAALLFEAATGKADADLSRYCKFPDAGVPNIVLKIPPK
jgi:hypothetical protein